MEPKSRGRATGQASRPVFGATTMRRGPDFSLPVNLTPTVMAAEMRSAPRLGPSSIGPSSARPASTVRSSEIAEVIGQEELPLQGASAIGPSVGAARLPEGVDESSLPVQPRGSADPGYLSEGVDPHIAAGATDARSTTQETPCPVPVEIRPVPSRGGRPKSVERYPFATLHAIEIDARGDMSGPSFLIPEADNPDNRLAAARKRYPDKRFISRRVPGGTLVWREA